MKKWDFFNSINGIFGVWDFTSHNIRHPQGQFCRWQNSWSPLPHNRVHQFSFHWSVFKARGSPDRWLTQNITLSSGLPALLSWAILAPLIQGPHPLLVIYTSQGSSPLSFSPQPLANQCKLSISQMYTEVTVSTKNTRSTPQVLV